jgi:hypothetical protein
MSEMPTVWPDPIEPKTQRQGWAESPGNPLFGDRQSGGGAWIGALNVPMEEVAPKKRDNLHTPEQMGLGSELGGDEVTEVHQPRGVGASGHGCRRRRRLKLGKVGRRWNRGEGRGSRREDGGGSHTLDQTRLIPYETSDIRFRGGTHTTLKGASGLYIYLSIIY